MHCSRRVPLESSYQAGNPSSALTGPTAERPVPAAGALAANALVEAAIGRARIAAAATARWDQRPLRPPARCFGGPLTRWVVVMVSLRCVLLRSGDRSA